MKNKTTLAFEMLEVEMEVISRENLLQIIGGFNSAQDMVDYMMDNGYSNYNSSNGFGNEDFGLNGYFGSNGSSSNGDSGYGSSSNGDSGYGSSSNGDSGYGSSGGGNGVVPGDPWDLLFTAVQFAKGLVTAAANYQTSGGIHPQYNAADPGNCVFDMLSYVNKQKNPTSTKTQKDFFDSYLFAAAADKNFSSGSGGFGFNYSPSGSLNGVNTSGNIMPELLNKISGISGAYAVTGSGIINALNNGQEIATFMPGQGPNGEGHAIIIKSYNIQNFTFTVFNPTTGSTSFNTTGGDLAGASYYVAF